MIFFFKVCYWSY